MLAAETIKPSKSAKKRAKVHQNIEIHKQSGDFLWISELFGAIWANRYREPTSPSPLPSGTDRHEPPHARWG